MPSSDVVSIPKVLSVVNAIRPRSVLDVGVGNGKYGVLFRECLDWNWGRLNPDDWEAVIDGIDIDESYITPIHKYVYNRITVSDWLAYVPYTDYDLIFIGDVLEHFPEGKWQQALSKARKISGFTLVVAPNWDGSIGQGSWFGHAQERHLVSLNPQKVGGRCLFANSKMFMCAFDNRETGILDSKDVCL